MGKRKAPPLFELAARSGIGRKSGASMSTSSSTTRFGGPSSAQMARMHSVTEPSQPEPDLEPDAGPEAFAPEEPEAHEAPEAAYETEYEEYEYIEEEAEGDEHFVEMLRPGQVVRIPSGYVYVAVAVVIALLLGTYMTAFSRGGATKERDLLNVTEATPADANSVRDPLLMEETTPRQTFAPANEPRRMTLPPIAGKRENQNAQPRESQAPPSTQTAGGDPRQTGLNYFIIARLRPAEAAEGVAFLVKNGVPASVFPSDDPALQWVIALQGFDGNPLNSSEGESLQRRILDVGRRWRLEGGVDDFSSMYARKHR